MLQRVLFLDNEATTLMTLTPQQRHQGATKPKPEVEDSEPGHA